MTGTPLGIVRGISYGLFGRPDEFVEAARSLGAGLVRGYVYWGQVEPEPGRYTWDAVDALVSQVDGVELWITLCSSSPWATRQPTNFLPPSPARDLTAYAEFVRRVVRRFAGRVRYWQCDNEPSNTGLLWAGTAEEYVAQLGVMYGAVKDVDPDASVVLGGCGYDVFASPPDSAPRRFFDHLAGAGRDAYDVFDVHLYADPSHDLDSIGTAREFMRRHGYLKPVVVGEFSGPVPLQFPEVEAAVEELFASVLAEPPPTQSTGELAARAGQDTPERRAMTALYQRMPQLPPKVQLFMAGCAADLEAKRHRINRRQLVMHTLLALSAGVDRTLYWNLAPEIPGYSDPYQLMHLMFGKLILLDYADGALGHRYPAAETFALLAAQLAGTERVTRIEVADRPSLYAFEVRRTGRGPLVVLWDHRDPFDGEDEPPVTISWPWSAPTASAVDAFGQPAPVEVDDGRVRVPVSLTPTFIGEDCASVARAA